VLEIPPGSPWKPPGEDIRPGHRLQGAECEPSARQQDTNVVDVQPHVTETRQVEAESTSREEDPRFPPVKPYPEMPQPHPGQPPERRPQADQDGRCLLKNSVYNNIHETPIRRAAATPCVPKIPILQNQVTTKLSPLAPKRTYPQSMVLTQTLTHLNHILLHTKPGSLTGETPRMDDVSTDMRICP
jgi:hypothetical protein